MKPPLISLCNTIASSEVMTPLVEFTSLHSTRLHASSDFGKEPATSLALIVNAHNDFLLS